MTGADSETAELSEPLVAHIKDLSTGEISLFNGTRGRHPRSSAGEPAIRGREMSVEVEERTNKNNKRR